MCEYIWWETASFRAQARDTGSASGGGWFVAGRRMWRWRRRYEPFPLNKPSGVNVLIYEIPTCSSCHNRSISNSPACWLPVCLLACAVRFPSHARSKPRQRCFPLARRRCHQCWITLQSHAESKCRFVCPPLTETSAAFMSDLVSVYSTCQNPMTRWGFSVGLMISLSSLPIQTRLVTGHLKLVPRPALMHGWLRLGACLST